MWLYHIVYPCKVYNSVVFFVWLVWFYFFETGFYYIALVGLEFAVWIRLCLDSEIYPSLPPGCWVEGQHHRAWNIFSPPHTHTKGNQYSLTLTFIFSISLCCSLFWGLFWRFHIISCRIWSFVSGFFDLENVFKTHPCYRMYMYFVQFYSFVILYFFSIYIYIYFCFGYHKQFFCLME